MSGFEEGGVGAVLDESDEAERGEAGSGSGKDGDEREEVGDEERDRAGASRRRSSFRSPEGIELDDMEKT
jgi:hypothetical protein